MKIEFLLALSIVFTQGCAQSNLGNDEDNGTAGSMDAAGNADIGGGESDDGAGGVDNPGSGMMGSVEQMVRDSACDTLGERRDATRSEEAEYCVCQDVYIDEPAIWSCYGPDPTNPPEVHAASCPTFIDSGGSEGNCEVSWVCDDGHNYSILCLSGGCSCQIDGVRRENLPRLEDDISTCINDLSEVNAVCFWELEGY